MKKSLVALALLASLSACQNSTPAPTLADSQLQTLADSHLALMRQQADQLAGELNQLQQVSSTYCQANVATPSALNNVKHAWRQSFAAWSAHQGQSGGPLDASGLSFAFQFWPDKKDSVGKQVQRELAAVAKGEPVPDRGVVTTLNAVEYLLESDLNQQQRCLLLPGITAQLNRNGQQLQAAWQDTNGYQQQLSQMQQQGGATVLLTEVLGQLAHRFDRIEKKLVLPLNTASNPRPLFGEAWRSQQSLHFLRTSLNTLAEEYHQGGMRAYLLSTKHQPQALALDKAFSEAQGRLPAGDSLAEWLKGDNYAQLLRFKLSLDQLGYQLKQALPRDLDISLGFNATDGD